MGFSGNLAKFGYDMKDKPLVDGIFTLKKGKEKGAWTFVEMPVLANVPKKKNSTIKVRGFIDAYELSDFSIWALKTATFLSVKTEIRKKINKHEGDSVKVVLYLDEAPMAIPDDFLVCLNDEPQLHQKFLSLPEAKQKQIVYWIFSAGTDEETVSRIGKALEALENGREKSFP